MDRGNTSNTGLNNLTISNKMATDIENNASENLPDRQLLASCESFTFIIFVVIIGVLCVVGIATNATSIVVFWKHKTSTVAIFLLEILSTGDAILLFLCIFIYTIPVLFPDKPIFYKIQSYIWPFSLMAHTVTVWITVLVTFTRYRAVCKPNNPNQMQLTNKVKLQVVALFGFAAIYNMPRFFEHQPIEVLEPANASDPNATATVVNLGDNQLYQIIYSNILYYPVMYIIPLVSLTYLNYRLISALKKVKARKKTMTKQKQKEDNVTVVIIVIVFVFILCQTPALANQIFWAALPQEKRECGYFHFYYTKLSDILVVINSAINFFVYILFGRKFRQIFLETVCGWAVNKDNGNGNGNNSRNSNKYKTCHTVDKNAAV